MFGVHCVSGLPGVHIEGLTKKEPGIDRERTDVHCAGGSVEGQNEAFVAGDELPNCAALAVVCPLRPLLDEGEVSNSNPTRGRLKIFDVVHEFNIVAVCANVVLGRDLNNDNFTAMLLVEANDILESIREEPDRKRVNNVECFVSGVC